jgi:transposase
LRDWLPGLGVTHVVMEATPVYWKPVYLLEDDFELLLVNAQQVQGSAGCSRAVDCPRRDP